MELFALVRLTQSDLSEPGDADIANGSHTQEEEDKENDYIPS